MEPAGNDDGTLDRPISTVRVRADAPASDLVLGLAGPLSEEFGWRGYVQPSLRQYYGRVAVTVVLGAAWGLWHVPLFFREGTGQYDKGLVSLEGLLFFPGLFPLTYTILVRRLSDRGGCVRSRIKRPRGAPTAVLRERAP